MIICDICYRHGNTSAASKDTVKGKNLCSTHRRQYEKAMDLAADIFLRDHGDTISPPQAVDFNKRIKPTPNNEDQK